MTPLSALQALTGGASAQAAVPTPYGNEADPTKGQPFNPLAIFSQHTGPGYTTSNVAAPVAAAPAFSLPSPFRTDLPPGLEQQYFATELTASIMASILGGKARLNSDSNLGGMVPVWVVDFFSPGGVTHQTWNAGYLYLYYQQHAGFTVSV